MDAFCHHSMLYQTHHHPPFLFQFPSTTPLFLSSSPHQEMECVEAAAAAVALSPQAILDANNGVSCDDFSVDDLFDFTNQEDFLEQQQLEDVVKVEEEDVEPSSQKRQKLSHEQHFSDETTNFDYSNISTDELAVPADDVANLEWLSHFVEDSFSEHSSAAYPAGMLTVKPMLPQPEKPATTTCFETPVPGKARSKRTRTGGRVWSRVSSSLTESSSSSSLSSSSSSLSASSSTPWFLCSTYEPVETEPASVEKKKKIQKRPAATESNGGSLTQPTRRCSHCGVTKTPQWRAGPMGAKTLCNACGVRFKSGRLFPEYRPACSPTFSTELHSNHHRKVIEMRRKKEGLNQTEPGLASTAVPSF